MRKVLSFLVVAFTFAIFQVSNVNAQMGDNSGMQGDHSGMHGDHSGMHGDHSGMTGGGDDPCIGMTGEALTTCQQASHGGPDCAALHPAGTVHVEPPEDKIAAIEAEMEASCKADPENCALSEASYTSLIALGHSRPEIECFLDEGKKQHGDCSHHPAGSAARDNCMANQN